MLFQTEIRVVIAQVNVHTAAIQNVLPHTVELGYWVCALRGIKVKYYMPGNEVSQMMRVRRLTTPLKVSWYWRLTTIAS